MPKARILIVEDEVIVARDIGQQLAELGFEPVAHCTTGEEAVQQAEQLRPDLVLMDIQLAGAMDGISAARQIREQLGLPVVFLTAFAETETLNRAKQAEPLGYIIKPFDERELRTVVEMALYKHGAEGRLRESEERYRLLFDHNPLPMLVFDTSDFGIVAVNDAAVRQYGYLREEFVGLNFRRLLDAEEAAQLLQDLEKDTLADKNRFESSHRRKDGTVFPVEVYARPMRFSGQPARLVLATDITEKKQLQEQFLRAQRLESLGMLASGIAHDLNNMLAPIMFAGPLLRTKVCTPRELKIIDTLEKSAERGSALVRQILAFAHGSSGGLRMTQLKHVARDVLSIIEVSFPKDITLEHHVTSQAWPVLANPTRIHQLLLNLCVNTRDAMPQGGLLTVTVDNRELTEADAAAIPGARAGAWLMLEVADTGTGIPPEVLPQVWNAFFTTKTPDKGTGLGLSTVRSIVDEHAGFIQLETAAGRGTAFRIFLPASREDVPMSESRTPFPEARGRDEQVLVVDDDASVREIIAAILGQFGYKVLACADGVDAIVQYNARSRDIVLVLTDVDMPNLDGAVLAGTLRKLNPRLPIVAMSGLAGSGPGQEKFEEIKRVAAAFLTKPFTTAELLNTVHRVLHP